MLHNPDTLWWFIWVLALITATWGFGILAGAALLGPIIALMS